VCDYEGAERLLLEAQRNVMLVRHVLTPQPDASDAPGAALEPTAAEITGLTR
jgi:hypothetical protein